MNKAWTTPRPALRPVPFAVVAAYAILASLWLMFFDSLLTTVTGDPALSARLHVYADGSLLLMTTVILLALVRYNNVAIRRAQEALQESEAWFRDITEAATDWIWEMDEHLRFSYLSERFYVLTGIQPEQVLGHTRWELATNDPDPKRWQHHKELLEKHLPFRDFVYRTQVLDERGHPRYFKISGKPIYDDRGQFIGYRGTGTDITEQRRAEEERARMQLYLKNIIDSMPSILIGVDPQGRITEWNQSAEKASGVSWENAQGRFFGEIFPQLEAQFDHVHAAIREHQPIKTQRIATEIDGEIRFADIMVYPLVANGALGAVIRMDDVTSQVHIEEMMVQTEKMLSVGGLAAGMAHEINNPLGVIMQGSQNIQRRFSLDLPKNREVADELGLDLEQIQRYLEKRGILRFLEGIREAGSRAAKIVSDMLAFSRRSESQFTPVDLAEMLDTAVRLASSDYDLKKQYDFKQIRIVRDYDPELGPVPCDKTGIEQVILNLLRNAAQAMAGAQTVNPTITLRTDRQDGYACIEVIDNGPGMDERTRKRAFEPFFTTKEVGVGTGLGLSVSYFIITEQHKGTLSMISTSNQGTRFSIRLPLAR